MNAASRSVLPSRNRSRRSTASSRVKPSRGTRSLATRSMPSRSQGQKVERLNTTKQQLPVWLRSLIILQRGSDWVAFLLIAATLTVYSWTVYTQQQWTQEYRKLETLQRNERQLTTTNETIKDQLAQQAERPETGLVTPTTASRIVIPPAPQRQFLAPPTQTPESELAATTPLGY